MILGVDGATDLSVSVNAVCFSWCPSNKRPTILGATLGTLIF